MDADNRDNVERESQDSDDNEIHLSASEFESDSSNETSDYKYATGVECFDGSLDESSDPYLACSTCFICYKRLKARIFSEACLHKFCFKCSEELTLRSRNKPEKRKCPVCRTSYKYLTLINVPNTDDEWKNIDDYSWKQYSYDFRKKIYSQNLLVQDLASVSEKFREFTPQLFKDNLLQAQRLTPWLEREVNILLNFSGVDATQDYIIQRIKDLLSQISIKCSEFASAIQPFFGSQTDHFVHEFYTFSCSFYDIHSFDDHAFYLTNAGGGKSLKTNLYLDIQSLGSNFP